MAKADSVEDIMAEMMAGGAAPKKDAPVSEEDALAELGKTLGKSQRKKKLRTPGVFERVRLGALKTADAQKYQDYLRKQGIDPTYDEGFEPIADVADIATDIGTGVLEAGGGLLGGLAGGAAGGPVAGYGGMVAGGALGAGLGQALTTPFIPGEAGVDRAGEIGERAKEGAVWTGLLGAGPLKGAVQVGGGKALKGVAGKMAGVAPETQKYVSKEAGKFRDMFKRSDEVLGKGIQGKSGLDVSRLREFRRPLRKAYGSIKGQLDNTSQKLTKDLEKHTVSFNEIVPELEKEALQKNPNFAPMWLQIRKTLAGGKSAEAAAKAGGAPQKAQKLLEKYSGDDVWSLYRDLGKFHNKSDLWPVANDIRNRIREKFKSFGGDIPENWEKYARQAAVESDLKSFNKGKAFLVKGLKGERENLTDEAMLKLYTSLRNVDGPLQDKVLKDLNRSGAVTPQALRDLADKVKGLDFLGVTPDDPKMRLSPSQRFAVVDFLNRAALTLYKGGGRLEQGMKFIGPGDYQRLMKGPGKKEVLGDVLLQAGKEGIVKPTGRSLGELLGGDE